jgi:hypothetical protein
MGKESKGHGAWMKNRVNKLWLGLRKPRLCRRHPFLLRDIWHRKAQTRPVMSSQGQLLAAVSYNCREIAITFR